MDQIYKLYFDLHQYSHTLPSALQELSQDYDLKVAHLKNITPQQLTLELIRAVEANLMDEAEFAETVKNK